MSDAEIGDDVLVDEKPIQHDGWRSRRAIASSIAGSVIFIAATAMLIISGHWSSKSFFSSDNWLSAVWIVVTVLAVGWGLMSVDKYAEIKKMLITAGRKR